MKRNVFAGLATGLALFATASLADPLEGNWRTAADDNGNSGLVHVVPCTANPAEFCGALTEAYGPDGAVMVSENVGRTIISEMAPRGGGEYRGRIYSPDRDRTYSSRVQLNGNTLAVRGCVFGICRDGGTWIRQN